MTSPSSCLPSYHWRVPLIENSVWVGVYLLGSAILWLLHPLAAAVYLAYSLVCMYLLVPRLVCTSCSYYGQTCHSGQGRIASLLFSPRPQDGFPSRFRYMRLAAPVFLAPLLAGGALLFLRLSLTLAGSTVLFGLLALGVTRFVTTRLGCPRCQQRHVCPAYQRTSPSAAS
jgi:hypothetical protein